MGIRDRLRGIKQFIKDPQGFSNRHLDTMSAEYAKVQKEAPDEPKEAPEPTPEEPQSKSESPRKQG